MILTSMHRAFLFVLIFAAIFFVCTHPLKPSQFGPDSDEGYYYRYAALVSEQGLPAFKKLTLWYAGSDEARKHPAPMRAGYILLGAALFKIFGPSFGVLGCISTVSFLAFLILCFYYIRKYFNLDTALMAALCLASSPLMLGLSRRALADSPANLLWGLCVWLFLDLLWQPKKCTYIYFVCALSAAITIKESSVVLLPFFVLTGWWALRQGRGISRFQILGTVLWPLLLVGIFYVWIYQGPASLMQGTLAILKTHFVVHNPNPYAIYYSSGPWFRYLVDFILLSPVVSLLFIGYVGYLLVRREALDFKKWYFLSYFVFVYTLLSALPHSKVVRFVLNLEMVMALFAVLMLQEIFGNTKQPNGRRWLVYSLAVIFVLNWQSFLDIFYVPGLLDPISYHLLVLRHFIPA